MGAIVYSMVRFRIRFRFSCPRHGGEVDRVGTHFMQMIALGEMTTLYPVNGAFVHYASRFIDPSVGFALGWVRSAFRSHPRRHR